VQLFIKKMVVSYLDEFLDPLLLLTNLVLPELLELAVALGRSLARLPSLFTTVLIFILPNHVCLLLLDFRDLSVCVVFL
jgi:chromate transport protein ChrA